MNNANRKLLANAQALIDQALDIITGVKEDEEEKLGNMPESLQSGEKGEKMQTGIEQLEEAISALEDTVIDAITNAAE